MPPPPEAGRWVVCFTRLPDVDQDAAFEEAASLVARDCEARGVRVPVLHDPAGAGAGASASGPGPAIVISSDPTSPNTHTVTITSTGPTDQKTSSRLSIAPGSAPAEIALRILETLEARSLIPMTEEDVYSPEEEDRLRKALDDLGYL